MRVLKMDMADEQSLTSAVDAILKEEGRIDVLFNNAGFGLFGSVEETPLKDARYQFEVNIFGLARLTQLVIPAMRKQQSGLIINTSSVGGKVYTPLGAWYHATKHALEGWSDCLRIEIQRFGIDVVVIEPGAIDTEFGDVLAPGLMEHSGSGPYKHIVAGYERMRQSSATNPRMKGSPPSVIAGVVSKAMSARRPKTRYVAGKFAKPMMSIRRWLGDRRYDKIIMKMIGGS